MPWADKLYGCDSKWWHHHNGTDFDGEKWSTHADRGNDKREVADQYGVNLVRGCLNDEAGFSTDPALIHYGNNSGYQAINLAILLGSPYIVLVGFNMSRPGGKGHFFGDYEDLYNQPEYEKWVPQFDRAARLLEGTVIVNATPDSAINCFPKMKLERAIENGRMYWNRTVANG